MKTLTIRSLSNFAQSGTQILSPKSQSKLKGGDDSQVLWPTDGRLAKP